MSSSRASGSGPANMEVEDNEPHSPPSSEGENDNERDNAMDNENEANKYDIPSPTTQAPEEGKTTRPLLYGLIIRQLMDDGFTHAARAVAEATQIEPNKMVTNNMLASLVPEHTSLSANTWQSAGETGVPAPLQHTSSFSGASPFDATKGRDVEPFPRYNTRFITTHKGACRAAAFSPDGKHAATGSSDNSIKLLETSKMMMSDTSKPRSLSDRSSTAVVRTFYDHTDAVNDLVFHPTEPLLISGGRDATVKFFDVSRAHSKRAQKQIVETHGVRSIDVHPSGGFLLVGTEHPMVRLYDLKTLQPFVSADVNRTHMGPITQVRYAPTAHIYATASKDGTVKIWDGVSNRCFNTITNAHSGAEVSSVRFSDDGKYLLTSGKDSTPRLWELSTGRQVVSFLGARHREYHLQTLFDYSGDYVLSGDEASNDVVVWSRATGEVVRRLPGHGKVVRWIAVSATEPCFISCSEDHRARFWAPEPDDDEVAPAGDS